MWFLFVAVWAPTNFRFLAVYPVAPLLHQVLTMRDLTPLQATFQLDVAVLECDSGETRKELLLSL
jgi:hypothetical protein